MNKKSKEIVSASRKRSVKVGTASVVTTMTNTMSKHLLSRAKSPESQSRKLVTASSNRYYERKVEKEIKEKIKEVSVDGLVSYSGMEEVLKKLKCVSGDKKNVTEVELVNELWTTLQGECNGTIREREIEEMLVMIMSGVRKRDSECCVGSDVSEITRNGTGDFIGVKKDGEKEFIKKKFAQFKINRLNQRLGEEVDEELVQQRTFSFTPRVSVKSTQFAVAARQKLLNEQSSSSSSTPKLSNCLSMPNLLMLQCELKDG